MFLTCVDNIDYKIVNWLEEAVRVYILLMMKVGNLYSQWLNGVLYFLDSHLYPLNLNS